MTDEAPETPAPAPEKAGLFEDFIDIFYNPSAVFTRRANSGFFLVLCLLTVVVGLLWFVNKGTMSGIMDAEISRSMAEAMKSNPAMTQDQLAMGNKVAGFMTTVGAFIGTPIAILIIGLGAWLTGKMLGATLSYAQASMVAAYAFMPRIIDQVAVMAQGMLLDTSGYTGRFQLTLGVGRFLSPDQSHGILGVLGRVDIFTLWVTVLLAIGIVVVGKLPKDKLIPAGAIMWVLGAIPAIWAGVKVMMKG